MNWNKINPNLLFNVLEQQNYSHLDFASPGVKNARDESYRHFKNGTFYDFQNARDFVTKKNNDVIDKMMDVLNTISPLSSTWLLFGERSDFELPQGGELISRSRPAWIIGVFAQGIDESKELAFRFYNLYQQWHANTIALWQISSLHNKNRINDNLVVSRILECATRLRWISDLTTLEIGFWVDQNLPELKSVWGSSMMSQINHNIENLLKSRTSEDFKFSQLALKNLNIDFIDSLTVKNRELNHNSLLQALESEDCAKYPIVKVGDNYLILNTTDWMFDREHSIIFHLMSKLPSHLAGKMLEDITKRILSKVGPTDIRWQSSVNYMDIENGNLEIDVIGKSTKYCFIGECKSSYDPNNKYSIDASYDQKIITKASEQLEKRIKAFENPDNQGKTFREGNVFGFIVTISSYAGAIWDYSRNPKALSIFPLKMLILCCSIFHTSKDMQKYLNWRSSLLSIRFKNSDELELIIAFINNQLDIPSKVVNSNIALMRAYEITDSLRLLGIPQNLKIKDNKSKWRKLLNDNSHPL